MYLTRSLISGVAAMAMSLAAGQASAQISGDVVRIGVLTDMNKRLRNRGCPTGRMENACGRPEV